MSNENVMEKFLQIIQDPSFTKKDVHDFICGSYWSVKGGRRPQGLLCLLQYLLDHSPQYTSPVCPIYLFDLPSIESLAQVPLVMARDGLISLVDFFYRYPRPTGITTMILIEENLASVVPPEWREQCLTYSFVSKKNKLGKTGPVKNIILTCTLDVWHTPVDLLKGYLEELKTRYLSKQKNAPKIFLVMSDCKDPMERRRVSGGKELWAFYKILQGELGDKVELVSAKEALQISAVGTYFFDINPYGFLYADSYTKQSFLMKGFQHLKLSMFNLDCSLDASEAVKPTIKSKRNKIISISPHHAISVKSLSDIVRFPYFLWDKLEADAKVIENVLLRDQKMPSHVHEWSYPYQIGYCDYVADLGRSLYRLKQSEIISSSSSGKKISEMSLDTFSKTQ